MIIGLIVGAIIMAFIVTVAFSRMWGKAVMDSLEKWLPSDDREDD